MNNVFFSIILPSYNRAFFLKNTISSVINQTYTDWELIIVDDASTDNTCDVVAAFNDERIKYVKNDINIERSASRNKGIDAALGKYICFLDSDDLWKLNHLQVIYNCLSENNYPVAMLFTGFSWAFSDDNIQNVSLPEINGQNLVEYIIEYQPSTSAVCLHNSIIKNNKFREDIRINEDVELFARIVSKYPLIKIPVHTITMIIHKNNTRGIVKDYITPQIQVFKLLCSQPETASFISKKFKYNRYKLLHSWLIKYLESTNETKKYINELLKFIVKYPFAQGNKARIVSLLYNLPFIGNLTKKFVRSLKRSRNG